MKYVCPEGHELPEYSEAWLKYRTPVIKCEECSKTKDKPIHWEIEELKPIAEGKNKK